MAHIWESDSGSGVNESPKRKAKNLLSTLSVKTEITPVNRTSLGKNPQKEKKTQMKINSPSSAFTFSELLVVTAVIAILAALVVPALTSARTKAQMTGTMSNARQLYLAQFQMSNDGAASGDSSLAWPGDLPGAPANLETYLNVLLAKGYLKGGDMLKLLNAPGCNLDATVDNRSILRFRRV